MDTKEGRCRTFYVILTSDKILIKAILWLYSTKCLIDFDVSFTIKIRLRFSGLNSL